MLACHGNREGDAVPDDSLKGECKQNKISINGKHQEVENSGY